MVREEPWRGAKAAELLLVRVKERNSRMTLGLWTPSWGDSEIARDEKATLET